MPTKRKDKKDNTGAITIRCPSKEPERAEFLRYKDMALAEMQRNADVKEGPTTFAELFRDMLCVRYAGDAALAQADETRIAKEHRGEEAPPADDLI